MILQRSIPFCLVLFGLFSRLPAQDLVYDNWQIEQGLPTNSVDVILQSSDGYLWTGTNGGLARFDGIRFQLYDMARTGVLSSNRIVCLMEDSRKRLWIGTAGGGLCYYEAGQFFRVDLKVPGSEFCTPSVLAEMPGIGLFVGTSQDGLFVIRPDSAVEQFLPSNGTYSRTVSNIFADDRGEIWIIDNRGILNYRQGKVAPASCMKQFKEYDFFVTARYDPIQKWVVGSFIPRPGSRPKLFLRKGDSLHVSAEYSEARMNNSRLLADRKGKILLQNNMAIYKVRLEKGKVLFDEHHLTLKEGLSEIASYYEDKEGNIWLGTRAKGLFRVKNNPFSSIDFLPNTAKNSTTSVIRDKAGRIWWTSPARDLFCLENGRIYKKTPPDILNLWVVYPFNNGVYAGGYDNRLMYIEEGKAQSIYFPQKGIQWTRALIYFDSMLWVGNHANLALLKDGKWIDLPFRKKLDEARINRFFPDSKGNLWICSEKEVFLYTPEKKLIPLSGRYGTRLQHVRSVYEHKSGLILLGSYGNGLYLCDGKTVRGLNSKHGLFDNTVSEIVLLDGYFWFTGNLGLGKLAEKELLAFFEGKQTQVNCTLYDKSDGLPVTEFNGGTQSNMVALGGKRYAYTSTNGLAIVDFGRIANNGQVPGVAIEEVSSGEKQIPLQDTLEIPFEHNRIEISYTALSLVSSKNNRFRYRMEGYETAWNEAGAERKAVYTNLPPGEYVFRVIASNNDGIWNKEGKSLFIRIPPPYYLTTWFRSLLVGALFLIVVFLFLLIIREIKKKEKNRLRLVEVEQNARMKAIMQTEEQERKRIAEDLHDGIGPLLSTVKTNLNLAESRLGANPLISASSNQIDQIARELRNISYNLMPSSLDNFGLAVAIREFVEKLNSAGVTTISFYETGSGTTLNKEKEVFLFRAVQEGLNNAIRHSEADDITVQMIHHDDALHLTIEDNGKGFDLGKGLENLQSRGLKNIRDRVEGAGGELRIDTYPGKGTLLSFDIPVEP